MTLRNKSVEESVGFFFCLFSKESFSGKTLKVIDIAVVLQVSIIEKSSPLLVEHSIYVNFWLYLVLDPNRSSSCTKWNTVFHTEKILPSRFWRPAFTAISISCIVLAAYSIYLYYRLDCAQPLKEYQYAKSIACVCIFPKI